MIESIFDYFRKTENYSTEKFIFEMLVLKIAGLLFIYFIIGISFYFNINLVGDLEWNERYVIENYHWSFALLIYCFIGPIFETFTTQFLPIFVFLFFTKNKIIPVIGSATFFTILHSYPSLILLYTFFSGVIYAWSFIVFWDKGCIAAVLVTSSIHGIYNLIPLMIALW